MNKCYRWENVILWITYINFCSPLWEPLLPCLHCSVPPLNLRNLEKCEQRQTNIYKQDIRQSRHSTNKTSRTKKQTSKTPNKTSEEQDIRWTRHQKNEWYMLGEHTELLILLQDNCCQFMKNTIQNHFHVMTNFELKSRLHNC